VRRIVQVVLLLLLLVHGGGPLFETVDHWDGFAQGGDDFVLSALGVIAGLGLTVLVGFLVRWVVPVMRAASALNLDTFSQAACASLEAPKPAPSTSPPLPLRI
jgi:hypothetical protein